jgi:flagellar basal body-associated protein FliL
MSDLFPETPRDKKARTEKIILTSVVVLLVVGMGSWLYVLMKKISKAKEK